VQQDSAAGELTALPRPETFQAICGARHHPLAVLAAGCCAVLLHKKVSICPAAAQGLAWCLDTPLAVCVLCCFPPPDSTAAAAAAAPPGAAALAHGLPVFNQSEVHLFPADMHVPSRDARNLAGGCCTKLLSDPQS
jgi:hypothetical protein